MDASNGRKDEALTRLGPVTPVADWRPRLATECESESWQSGVLGRQQVEQLMLQNQIDSDTLLQALVPVAAQTALPYLSGFYVGAVGLGASGCVYLGCNLEFLGATLAASVHAEQCLIANLVRNGEQRLEAVAISAPPCGHCRQFLSEMCCADTVRLIFGEGPGNVYRLADVLPHRFGPHDLLDDRSQPLLLEEQAHDLALTSDARAVLDRRKGDAAFVAAAAAALKAAAASYSPYHRTPAGAALVSPRGVHSGGLVENAAYNPTLPPLQAAFADAVFAGLRDYTEVSDVVLVEVEGAPLRHEPATRVLLEAVAPRANLTVLLVEQRQ